MRSGKWFLSTGFQRHANGWWHVLVALHLKWRLDFVRPQGKPGYRRIYLGPLEIEWSSI